MFDKDRTRRVLYNDDAEQLHIGYEGYDYKVTNDQSFLDARTTPTFDTHVDTYVWCVGNGAEPTRGGKYPINPCLGSSTRGINLIVQACHAQGMEVWASLRMNDIHDSFMADTLEDANEPIKAEHPEYLIGSQSDRQLPRELTERYLWTALNFARPEVRQYRLDFIKDSASQHDFDGYELDFTRFIWNFPLGAEREYVPLMTDFIRQVRATLNLIADQRGRPYTFVVHVMDSVEMSLELGRDVAAWLDEGLVDVLVVGMGYMPYVQRLDQWLALGKQYNVPIYPSVNTNTFTRWFKNKFERTEAWHEAIRATAAWFWQQGADGIYFFNLFCQQDKNVGPMPNELVFAPLSEVGDPHILRSKDKIYAIQPTRDSGFCLHGSAPALLPIALDNVERKLPLQIGPDADDPQANFSLRIYTTGGDDQTQLRVRLNHTLLADPKSLNGYWELTVPAGVMRSGYNELNVWSNQDVLTTRRPMIVHEIFASVTY